MQMALAKKTLAGKFADEWRTVWQINYPRVTRTIIKLSCQATLTGENRTSGYFFFFFQVSRILNCARSNLPILINQNPSVRPRALLKYPSTRKFINQSISRVDN